MRRKRTGKRQTNKKKFYFTFQIKNIKKCIYYIYIYIYITANKQKQKRIEAKREREREREREERERELRRIYT